MADLRCKNGEQLRVCAPTDLVQHRAHQQHYGGQVLSYEPDREQKRGYAVGAHHGLEPLGLLGSGGRRVTTGLRVAPQDVEPRFSVCLLYRGA